MEPARPRVDLPANAQILVVGHHDSLLSAMSHRGFCVHSVMWNDAIDPALPNIAGLVLIAPESQMPGEALSLRAFRWIQAFGPSLRQQGNALLAAVTHRGGRFGLNDALLDNADAAGVAGLIKTASREWPVVSCKVIDIDSGVPTDVLLDELLTAGPLEVGIRNRERMALELEDRDLASERSDDLLSQDELVVVSGGARGVTAACVQQLANRFRPAFLLLGRTHVADKEPDYLTTLHTEAEIKQNILSRWSGSKPTPRRLEQECTRVLAAREIRATVEAIRAAGARVEYRSVDIRNASDVAEVVAAAREKFGPVRGVIHGSGVIADRRIEAKTAEQFISVYETKVDGLRSLLTATEGDPLKFAAMFSSTTARFGRLGQADYAAANEVVNAMACLLAHQRPDCRVVSFNWGPWDGGMVTPALRQLFEAENVGVIPLDTGAQFFVDELCGSDESVEVIVLGPPPQTRSNTPAANTQEVFRRELNVASCPVLQSHILAGRAVFPIALAMEWLAHAAMLRNPGLAFCGCDDLRVLHPLAVDLDGSAEVALVVGTARRDGSITRVPVELHGPRTIGLGPCYRAEITLGIAGPTPPTPASGIIDESYPLDIDDAYVELLFHGPELRGLEAITGIGPGGISAVADRAPVPSAWFAQPLRTQWMAEPLVIDCALQAMILWGWQYRSSPSLPCGWKSYRQYRPFRNQLTTIHCHVTRPDTALPQCDFDFVAEDGSLIARISGCEYVINAGLRAAFRSVPSAGGVNP